MPLFHDLPRNTRNCLVVEPLWALFGGVIFYYAPLYMKDLGLDDVEMGIINSAGLAFSFLFFLLAGPLTNKFGRWWTTLIWDCFSWTVCMILWGFAQDFWWFFAAVFFSSGSKITQVSWNMLVSEDAREDQRVKVFAIVNLMGTLGGIVSLGAGLLLDHFGVVPTMRFTYWAGAVSMTTMFVVRAFFTVETENGRRVRESYRTTSLLTLIREQLVSLFHAAKDAHFSVLTSLFLVTTAVTSFTFFQILYLKDVLGYTTTELAFVPAVNSVLTVALLTLVIPRIPRGAERRGLLVGFIGCLAAAAAFLLLGKDMLWAVLAVQGLGAASLMLVLTYRDSVFMNSVEEHKRAELYSLVNLLAMLLSIPSGAFAGWLANVTSVGQFVALVALFVGGAVLAVSLIGQHRKTSS
jgi:MFS family permease